MVGAASEHYRADLTSFFGFDLARWLPYNLVRTWHVQLAIFWTATSFLATGLFLAPIVSGKEPRRQSWLAYGLLGALAVVVFGSLIGELLDIHGWLSPALHAIGMQGWEYLDLGRVWQVLLTLGLFFWAFMLYRGLRGALQNTSRINMPWLFFFTGLAIPAFLRGRSADQLGVQLHRGGLSGGSWSCTCGWRTSSRSSPPCWWRTCSCCSVSCASGWP
jgi:nitric oxide reductase subunit B